MDRLTFISKMAEVLIWPAVVLIVVGTFHKNVRDLLKRIESWEGFGAKLGFKAVYAVYEESSPQAKLTKIPDETAVLVKAEPGEAVTESWMRFAAAVGEARTNLGPSGARRASEKGTLRSDVIELYNRKVISRKDLELFNQLNALYKAQIRLGGAPSPEASRQFVVLTQYLIDRVEGKTTLNGNFLPSGEKE